MDVSTLCICGLPPPSRTTPLPIPSPPSTKAAVLAPVGLLSRLPSHYCPWRIMLTANIHRAFTVCQHFPSMNPSMLATRIRGWFCYPDKGHARGFTLPRGRANLGRQRDSELCRPLPRAAWLGAMRLLLSPLSPTLVAPSAPSSFPGAPLMFLCFLVSRSTHTPFRPTDSVSGPRWALCALCWN